jgi:hypothetical protein
MLLAACVTRRRPPERWTSPSWSDGQSLPLSIAAGSTVQQVLQQALVELGQLIWLSSRYTVLTGGSQVVVTRRTERFEIEQIVIPFPARP